MKVRLALSGQKKRMNVVSPHPAELPPNELLQTCKITRTRGSGPGGQHRNKVETAIVIEHMPTGVIGQASEKRSQERNREIAFNRLRVNLAVSCRTERQNVSDLWVRRTQSGRLQVNENHFDYAAILAELLDYISTQEFDVASAAKKLSVSTSQAVKFLKTCRPAFEWVNRRRIELQKSTLR